MTNLTRHKWKLLLAGVLILVVGFFASYSLATFYWRHAPQLQRFFEPDKVTDPAAEGFDLATFKFEDYTTEQFMDVGDRVPGPSVLDVICASGVTISDLDRGFIESGHGYKYKQASEKDVLGYHYTYKYQPWYMKVMAKLGGYPYSYTIHVTTNDNQHVTGCIAGW